jgi:formylglycine-generating enzyme required for sulfatase activity
MKHLIAPIVVIVALIAFFVIIDRKEFNRHEDVQTVQRESPTSNRKPTVSVPETKPVTESKSTIESRHVEKKSIEIKSASPEEQPLEGKSDGSKSESDTAIAQPENKNAPMAIPVLTPEEAELSSQEAFRLFEERVAERNERLIEEEKWRHWGFDGNVALPGGVKLEMVLIPAGKFLRDDGRTVHLTKSYWLGKYEVTNEQWRAVMSGRCASQDGKDLSDPSYWKGARRPVEGVSWNDAMDFCKRLNELYADKLPRGYRIDLPTEAQWEYACRACMAMNYSYGDASDADKMNFDGTYPYGDGSKGVCREATVDVGSLGYKNAFGLYDMHGNVFEWCRDWYEPYGGDTTDPTGPATGSLRVRRGGSWFSSARDCCSASRNSFDPGHRNSFLGFRLALVPVQ